MNSINDRESAHAFLFGRINYERTDGVPYRANALKLDRMSQLLSHLGDPQLRCPTIHIAGTKGKGSTAVMTACILSEAGLSTGLYTSPHLERLEERFTVDGRQCEEDEFTALVARIAGVVETMDEEARRREENGPTFFEITTALAWMLFAQRQVDCAVVEVGLGGRLDSSNVCRPTLTAVTTISLDHTRQLGDTVESIAAEKGGIIKAGVPVVLGRLDEAPQAVLESIAAEMTCDVYRQGQDFEALRVADGPPKLFQYREGLRSIDDLRIRLLGEHQQHNAAMAVFLATAFCQRNGRQLHAAAVRSGLLSAACPARVELLGEYPTVLLDAAHNPASAEALGRAVELFPVNGSQRTLVFATSRDKNARAMLDILGARFERVVFTQFQENPRAIDPGKLAEQWNAPPGVEIVVDPDPQRAWRQAYERTRDAGLVCVAGSFFLAAELRRPMQESIAQREARLSRADGVKFERRAF